jgi:hypothetical protein
VLPRTSVSLIVGLVLRVPSSFFLGIGKIIVDIEVDLLLGVGMVVESLVDGAFQSVLLLSLEEIKQGLVICCNITVQL